MFHVVQWEMFRCLDFVVAPCCPMSSAWAKYGNRKNSCHCCSSPSTLVCLDGINIRWKRLEQNEFGGKYKTRYKESSRNLNKENNWRRNIYFDTPTNQLSTRTLSRILSFGCFWFSEMNVFALSENKHSSVRKSFKKIFSPSHLYPSNISL